MVAGDFLVLEAPVEIKVSLSRTDPDRRSLTPVGVVAPDAALRRICFTSGLRQTLV